MFQTLELAVEILAMLCVSYGFYLLFRQSLRRYTHRVKVHIRAKREKAKRKRGWKDGKFYRHFDHLLCSTKETKQGTEVEHYLVFSSALFCTTGVAVYLYIDSVRDAFLCAAVVTGVPYVYKRLRLRAVRIQAGYDLAAVNGNLLAKYRSTHFDMTEAIKQVILECKNKNIRRRLKGIVMVSQTYVHRRELQREIDLFIFLVGSTFAHQLGLAMLKSISEDMNVEKTLESLDMAMQTNMEMLHDEKSKNQEIGQLAWFHIIVFPLTFIFALWILPFEQLVEFQIRHPEGRFWFSASAISILTAVFVAVWFRKPKNDL